MKSNFYFGSSDAPYPPTFPIVSPLPLPSFYPFSRNLLASSPSFSSIFPAFPSSVRISRARNVFATHPPPFLRSELRPHDLDYRKPGPCPFFLFFFSPLPSIEIRHGKGGRRGREGPKEVWRKSNVFNRENVTDDDGEGWINF